MKIKVKDLAMTAVIAAFYVVLTFISAALGLSSGVIQVRFSEILCVLPYFLPAAVPGLCIGCVIANLLTGSIMLDVVFGSLATLIGALGTYFIGYYARKKYKGEKLPWIAYLSSLPPIISNMIIVSLLLKFAYGAEGGLPYFMLTVGIGEAISVGGIGTFFLVILNRYKHQLFKKITREDD